MKDKKFAITLYEYKDDNKTICPLDVIKEGTFLTILEDSELKDWYKFIIHIDSNSSGSSGSKDKKEKLKGMIPCSYVKYPVSSNYNAILDREFQSFDEFYYLVLKRIDNLDDSIDQEKLIEKLFEVYENDKSQPNKEFLQKFPFPDKLLSIESIDKYSKFNKFILYLIIRIGIFDANTFPFQWLFNTCDKFENVTINDVRLSQCVNQFLSTCLEHCKLKEDLATDTKENVLNLCWLFDFDNFNSKFKPITETSLFERDISRYSLLAKNSFFINRFNSRSSHAKFLFTQGFITHFFNSSKHLDFDEQEFLFQSFKLLQSNRPLDFKDQVIIDKYIVEFVKNKETQFDFYCIKSLLVLDMVNESQESKLYCSTEIIENAVFYLWELFKKDFEPFLRVIQQFKFSSNYIDQIEIAMFNFIDSNGKWKLFFDEFIFYRLSDTNETINNSSKKSLFSNPFSNLINYFNPIMLGDLLNPINDTQVSGKDKDKIREIGNQYIKSFEIKSKSDIIELIKLSVARPNFLSAFSCNINDLLFTNLSDQTRSMLVQEEFIFIISKEIEKYSHTFLKFELAQPIFPVTYYIASKFGFSLDCKIFGNGISKLEYTFFINDDKLPLTIPKKIDTLHILYGFNQLLAPGLIPDFVQCLYLHNISNLLTIGSIPESIKVLHLLHGFDQLLTSGIIPDSIKNLHLYDIKQPLIIGSIPNTLMTLHLGDGFNQTLSPGIIPESVKILFINDIKQPLIIGSIPNTIKEIYLGDGFNQTLSPGVIPESVEIFTKNHQNTN